MKTLVIVTHPDIESSFVNKRWIEELNKFPDKYHVHQLYNAYPDEKIDVQAEQKLVEQYNKIVFQFPFYWYNSPPLLKKWFDEVLTYGWAFGSESGYKVSREKIALAISLGGDEHEYDASGSVSYTLEEITRPFELSFEYVKADYQPPFAYYGMEQNTSVDWVESSVPLYLKFLDSF